VIDRWFVYPHSIKPGQEILRVCSTPSCPAQLRISHKEGSFKADFDLETGEVASILLERNLLDVASYSGEGASGDRRYGCRVVAIDEPDLGLRALVGHVSRIDREDPGHRDIFMATRERRTVRPSVAGAYQFSNRMKVPLYDHQPPARGDLIQLSERLIFVEQQAYEIQLTPGPSQTLWFTARAEKPQRQLGGLVLPLSLAQPEQHLLMVCFHHLHTQERHLAAGDDGEKSGQAGHPICTSLFGAYAPL
jgi:hypothetical protein